MNTSYLIAMFLFLGGMIVVALVLGHYRDRLQNKFVTGPIALKGSIHLGDGARLCLVEVDGINVLCGVGRQGVGSMQILPQPTREG